MLTLSFYPCTFVVLRAFTSQSPLSNHQILTLFVWFLNPATSLYRAYASFTTYQLFNRPVHWTSVAPYNKAKVLTFPNIPFQLSFQLYAHFKIHSIAEFPCIVQLSLLYGNVEPLLRVTLWVRRGQICRNSILGLIKKLLLRCGGNLSSLESQAGTR